MAPAGDPRVGGLGGWSASQVGIFTLDMAAGEGAGGVVAAFGARPPRRRVRGGDGEGDAVPVAGGPCEQLHDLLLGPLTVAPRRGAVMAGWHHQRQIGSLPRLEREMPGSRSA